MALAWFATDFDPDVSLGDVVTAVWDGASQLWEGEVKYGSTDLGELVLQYVATVDGEEIICETFSPFILGSDGQVRLVTAVLDAPIQAPQLAEYLHRSVNELLNAAPVEPLTGEDARVALVERSSELLSFGGFEQTEDESTDD
jgi:hypothetical protein